MNADQKKRATELLSAWRATTYALHGDRMADLLQELMDAPEVLTATNPAQISSLEPAPSVPDGWRELCRRLYVELFHCDKQMTNTRDEDGEPVWRTGATVRAVLDDAKAALVATPTPAEPPADVAHTDDLAVDRFATAMKAKMARSRDCGRYGWDDPAVCTAEDLRLFLVNHIAKGDPVDVGNFAMMLFNRGETTATKHQPEPSADVARDAERLDWLLRKLPGVVLRYCVGVLSDTSDGKEFRAAIDAAIERQGGES